MKTQRSQQENYITTLKVKKTCTKKLIQVKRDYIEFIFLVCIVFLREYFLSSVQNTYYLGSVPCIVNSSLCEDNPVNFHCLLSD